MKKLAVLFSFLVLCSVLFAGTYKDLEYQIMGDYIEITGYSGSSTSVEIPDTIRNLPVMSIRSEAFNSEKIKSITIPEGVTVIYDYAFYNCTSLSSVLLPSTLNYIGERAFSGCTSLNQIALPGSVTTLGAYCFENSGLTSILIPNQVTQIPEGAFYGCKSLKEIVLHDEINSIGRYAFAYTQNLTLTIPNGVTKLGNDGYSYYSAFQNCTSPTITIGSQVTSFDNHLFVSASDVLLYVKKGSKAENFAKKFGYDYIYY